MYIAKPGMADSISKSLGGLYTLVYNKYFVDEMYDAAIIHPTIDGSRTVLWRGLDAGTIDGAVNGGRLVVTPHRQCAADRMRPATSGHTRPGWLPDPLPESSCSVSPEGCDEPVEHPHRPSCSWLRSVAAFAARHRGQGESIALVLSICLIFAMSLGLIGPVLNSGAARSFEVNVPWIDTPAIRYHVALDGLSLWLVILSTLLTPLCILISYIQDRQKEYYAFLLLLEVV